MLANGFCTHTVFLMTRKQPLAESRGFKGTSYLGFPETLHLLACSAAPWLPLSNCESSSAPRGPRLLPSNFDAQHATTALAPAAMNPQTPAAGSGLPAIVKHVHLLGDFKEELLALER